MNVITHPAFTTKSWANFNWIDLKDPTLALYIPLWFPDAETTGSTIISKDLNHHSCAATNATWGVTGRTFAGTGNINLTNVLTAVSSATTGTIIVWVAPDDSTPVAQEDLTYFADTDAVEGISLGLTAETGAPNIVCYDGGATQFLLRMNANPFSSGEFGMLSAVQNGTSPVLYYNDTQPNQTFINSTNKTKWFSDCTEIDNGYMGARSINGGGVITSLSGKIGMVRIYNRALSLAEVTSIYDKTKWRYL